MKSKEKAQVDVRDTLMKKRKRESKEYKVEICSYQTHLPYLQL